jgi:hypothetical protein
MGKDTNTKPSALDKFNLSFEYDISWHAARKAVRIRTNNE